MLSSRFKTMFFWMHRLKNGSCTRYRIDRSWITYSGTQFSVRHWNDHHCKPVFCELSVKIRNFLSKGILLEKNWIVFQSFLLRLSHSVPSQAVLRVWAWKRLHCFQGLGMTGTVSGREFLGVWADSAGPDWCKDSGPHNTPPQDSLAPQWG